MENRSVTSKLNKERYGCSQCSKRFMYRYNVVEHSRVHTGVAPFECPMEGCVMRFKWRSSVKCHLKKCRSREGHEIKLEQKNEAAKSSVHSVSSNSEVSSTMDQLDKIRTLEDLLKCMNAAVSNREFSEPLPLASAQDLHFGECASSEDTPALSLGMSDMEQFPTSKLSLIDHWNHFCIENVLERF
eukprot:Plantae.Rhodophyta-Purpureofilum_apyrenoidigerum.ctg18788.p1 GENE.Plantae.Rhodophyta-Purpureofilum_apyrenoidigerum.ctg18788~~Plantae.Rhodophyta-Purpureofilum_apyrenoidigerum.ctg18788.p1  ORF type:complete len:186 (+),score=27.85 Plantae.Rhodophyta-Purpureofilum_apyrenoidigerum.ctg18788:199-756(+)